MVDFGFLLENFGNVVRTFKFILLLCECRWGGGSTWINTTCCNQTCLKFLHSEVLGTQKPSFQLPSHPNPMLLHPRWQGHLTTLYLCTVLLLCPCGGHDASCHHTRPHAFSHLCPFVYMSFSPSYLFILVPSHPCVQVQSFTPFYPCVLVSGHETSHLTLLHPHALVPSHPFLLTPFIFVPLCPHTLVLRHEVLHHFALVVPGCKALCPCTLTPFCLLSDIWTCHCLFLLVMFSSIYIYRDKLVASDAHAGLLGSWDAHMWPFFYISWLAT